jgi:hypothetical protein
MCRLAREQQQPIAALIDALDAGGLDALKTLAANCPACIVAALRQRRKRDPVSFDHLSLDYEYDFKGECAKFFGRVDEEEEEREQYA